MFVKRSIVLSTLLSLLLAAALVQIGRTAYLQSDASIYLPIVLNRPMPPTSTQTVGNGTAASCTETALQNALQTAGSIAFACGTGNTTIKLTEALHITQDSQIDGVNQIIFDGDGRSALFTVAAGVSFEMRRVTLQNSLSTNAALTLGENSVAAIEAVTFTNNVATVGRSYCGGGGALSMLEGSQVTIIGSLFSNNSATNGGAIHNQNGALVIQASQFLNNQALQATRSQLTLAEQYEQGRRVPTGVCAGGGAIYTDGVAGKLTISDSRFEGNMTNQHGGALFLALRSADTVTILDSSFENNIAHVSSEWSGTGGALWLGESQSDQQALQVVIGESAFVGNSAEFQGGAIYSRIPLHIENSTLTENIARNPAISDLNAWQRGSGGALRIDQDAHTILDHVTLARNVAGYHGGGISGSGAVARNTLIANNRAEWANDSYHNCTHEINNWGHNIQFVDAQTASQCGDTIWTRDPLLGSLGLHNGQTQSIALLAGSAAIDAGNPTTCKTYDQRHIARTYGTACDIGAFEAVDPVAPTATSPSETNTPVPTATSATATPTPEITPTQQNTPTATPTDTGGTATPTPSPTPSSTPVSGTGSTVGDGTAASCTEAAFAQALALGGVVRFDCGSQPVTIPLTQRHMMLIDTTIDGGNLITLDGQHATALLGSEERLSIELHNLTLINGHSHEEGAGINVGYWNAFSVHNVTFSHHTSLADHKVCDGGGAIFIGGGGVTTIENSSFYDNAAMNGGAINNLRTKLTILDSVFEGNEALHSAEFNTLGDCGGGGALYFDGTRKPEDGGADLVILRNLQFIDNLTNNVGGAIFLAVRTNERVLIEDVLFKGNRAIQGPATFDTSKGGALWIGQGVGGQTGYQIDLNRVSFIDNHSEFQGGALWTRSPAKLTNVTFFGNTAIDHRITDPDNWRAGIGGAITAADQAVVSLQHTSVVSNTAGFVGGGINGDNFILMNSLIANNAGLWWRGLQQNCTQHPQNWGGNLQYLLNQPENKLLWNSNCGDSIVVADPKVGTPVQFSDVGITIPLQADSGAIDIGAASKCLSVDQRGVPRPSGGACDSGAYEYSTARSKERH